MESLKKLAVLLAGLAMIVLVVWLLSISLVKTNNNSQLQKQKAKREFVPPKEDAVERPETLRDSDQFSANEFEEPDEKPLGKPDFSEKASRPTARDTISWLSLSDAEKRQSAPVISGKMPMNGNPNPIFMTAAKRILPAVVSIQSSRRIKHPSFNFFQPFSDPDDEEKSEEEAPEEEYRMPGSGSGILINNEGYILTNHHVIEGAEAIKVMLYDKREFEAEIVGGDPTTDIAMIKVAGADLPNAFIGNSDSVHIGEWVMAVGNPLNFTSTVTSGIVSAIGRSINIINSRRYRYRIENFIQTDAVINPGNSGGALVNLQGEVIGMNTAIATRSGYYQGYGFAIPINLAKKVGSDLITYGRVRRAILGVTIDQVTDQVARANGLPRPTGSLIQAVNRNSPADKAGLQQGDIVLSVDGEKVVSVNDLQIKIAQHRPGERVQLVIWRDGEEWDVEVELGEAPHSSEDAIAEAPEEPAGEDMESKPSTATVGLAVREFTEEEVAEFGVEKGLFIEKVASGSLAEKAGIISGYVLISIDEEPVNSLEDLEEAIAAAASGDFMKFTIELPNGEQNRICFVEIP